MTSPITETITHTEIVDTITKTYNSEEFLKEAGEIITNGEEIVSAVNAPVGDTISNVEKELAKKDPNYLKVVLTVLLSAISIIGSFFGVWFGARNT